MCISTFGGSNLDLFYSSHNYQYTTRHQNDKIYLNFDELSCLKQPELYRLCTVDCDLASYYSYFGM